MANIDPPMQDVIEQEMTEFHLWKTFPVLKRHAMTYFDGETLFRYAQCSKLCNNEIQKFHNFFPEILRVENLENGLTGMKLAFKRQNKENKVMFDFRVEFIDMENGRHTWTVTPLPKSICRRRNAAEVPVNEAEYAFVQEIRETRHPTRVFQTVENLTYEGNATEAAAKYLERLFRNSGKVERIYLNVPTWPDQLTNLFRKFYKCQWDLYPNEAIFNKFLEFAEDSPERMKIKLPRQDGCSFQPPSDFYETNFFQNIEKFTCATQTTMTEQQFLESNASYLAIVTPSFSNEIIHQKIRKWFDAKTPTRHFFNIMGRMEHLDKHIIIGNLPFQPTADLDDQEDFVAMRGSYTAKLQICRFRVSFQVREYV